MQKKTTYAFTSVLRSIMALGLLVFVLFYFQINISYKHSHILADGSKIEHSHPYNTQNDKNHSHSKKEMNFLSFFSKIDSKQSSFCFLELPALNFIELVLQLKQTVEKETVFEYFRLRAPPKMA